MVRFPALPSSESLRNRRREKLLVFSFA
jgi:hypothetical protein